ncbi:P-loop ATPase, Sll1717 family [Methylocystis sp.]|uniref:P-loop ATPase, Sll1717 family n=1 Tax=Methylocystis sp. TaxID=1911079 RepID=UPI003DA451D0
MQATAFIAYPAGRPIISEAINDAVERSNKRSLLLRAWEKVKIVGLKLDDLIREEIASANVLVADVTYPNFNVYYEMGYAAALGKPVIPTINTAVEKAMHRLQEVGLFDTIGWASYNNSHELTEKLDDWSDVSWRNNYQRRRDYTQPLFLLDTLVKTDFRNHIVHAVVNSDVNMRSFDPAEVPRLTAAQAIADVSASAGIIVPILSEEIADHHKHNLRAAFIIGLSHGFEIEPLAIQYDNGPAPVDYRDFITNSTFRGETIKHVEEYCRQTLIRNQQASARSRQIEMGLLAQIDLGSPAAENETQQLKYYFVQTAEYARALRAEGAVITGRKGSGKSAIYFQVADDLTREKRRCVVDLRPASHNLSEMREALLSVVNAGILDHTVAAFWQYIMYVEILLKLREMVLPRAKNDFSLQERIRNIEEQFELDESIVAGDFTSRLETAVRTVIEATSRITRAADVKTQLTNLLFEQPIPKLRDAVLSFHDMFDAIAVLIDDLDKGWPPRRIEAQDVGSIKHLIEVLNKMQRDLSRRRMTMKHLVFLRSDIYERLVEETSDRGKYNVIKVDWSDPQQLEHLLRQRIESNLDKKNWDQGWEAINPTLSSGGKAIDDMIAASLRRPRFLIDLCERTLSFAVNRGHSFVNEADVDEGMRQMSLYLVSDFGYEMRDVTGSPEDILYSFIGVPAIMPPAQVDAILDRNTVDIGKPEMIDLLLWYGFLGVATQFDKPIFIYDRAYDFRRLEAERTGAGGDLMYAVNPAFLKGLTKD